MKKAFGYCRVSTDEQAVDGVSLEAQQARIQAWCLANDIELVACYVDAVSGKRVGNRPELQKALGDVCRAGGVLVVYSLSRLARSTKDTLEISEQLERAGADLVSLSEKLDTTSAAGKMVFRMLAVLSEFERDLVSERTSAALQHKRRKGERVGRVPVGFDLADDGVRLLKNADEQRVLVLIKELRGSGLSMRAIAAELTERGIPTKASGKAWSHGTIQKLLERAA